MTETINHKTGEIATVDTSSEVAVTGYLQHARDWLATAVESTGPEQIAAAKAEIATAAEATKQLGLSKEIQSDAAEMVRRAEYTVRKAITKAQVAGEVRDRRDGTFSPGDEKVSPIAFFNSKREYEDANAMADLEPQHFEEVLTAAREEGNLSRANVATKARDYVKAAAEDLAAGIVTEFPALKFFADRGETRRVVDLGVALRGYEPGERQRRLAILDKTIAYEKRLADQPAAEPTEKPRLPMVVNAFSFARKSLEHSGGIDAVRNEIAATNRNQVAEWHRQLRDVLSELEFLIAETAPKLRSIQ